jgi:plasmid stability protein
MPVTLSIKNIPGALVKRLRERARRHGRPLEAEVIAILEAAATDPLRAAGAAIERPLTPREVLAEVRRLGLTTPREAAAMIRKDRDGR